MSEALTALKKINPVFMVLVLALMVVSNTVTWDACMHALEPNITVGDELKDRTTASDSPSPSTFQLLIRVGSRPAPFWKRVRR